MSVRLSENMIEERLLQSMKAALPIEVTEEGIESDTNSLQFLKELSSIEMTVYSVSPSTATDGISRFGFIGEMKPAT